MRGLSRWVTRLITPPLPAASRPSNSTTTLSFLVDHPVLQLDQLALQPQQLREIAVAVDARAGVGREHLVGHAFRQAEKQIVVDLELELLVDAVDHFVVEQVLEALAVWSGGHLLLLHAVLAPESGLGESGRGESGMDV